MMPKNEQYDSNTLAGEYVLGTLEGNERADFESRLQNDLRLQGEVDAWQQRFAPLLDGIESVTPPDSLWQGVEQRLESRQEPTTSLVSRFWDSLSFWRNLGLVTATIMLTLGLTLMTGQQNTGMDSVLVVMNDQAKTGWVVGAQADKGFINVKAVEPSELPVGKVCQLWVEDEQGNLHPVGLLPHDGHQEMSLPIILRADSRFKVSIEDMDQIPTDKPSNVIVFEGNLIEI